MGNVVNSVNKEKELVDKERINKIIEIISQEQPEEFYGELYAKCKNTFSDDELAVLKRAIAFTKKVHEHQLRQSGEPYYVHPEAVAIMLYDMGMDSHTVLAGLMHDVVEDGDNISVDIIEELFSKDVADMVNGVTKLTKSGNTNFVTKEEQQAESLRKMFLAIANDVRVVIIKLADRLHNMRTLEYCEEEKRRRKAKETLDVYAPLAHRFGMGAIKCELEDISFQYLMPEEYEKLKNEIEIGHAERVEILEKAMDTIKRSLKVANIEAQINGRPKHLYSIYRKLKRQNCTLNDVYDLIAVRVIVNTVRECYDTLGIVHSLWRPVPGRFKDYISTPKPNMYRSIHTTLFGEKGIPFEVQIRTYEMHRMAEFGIASHWMYKEGRKDTSDLDNKFTWLRQALEEYDDTASTKEFIDSICRDFFSDYVFVLTPKGEIIDLPIGSTPLDFAYKIHTNVGNKAHHAKVNGNIVKFDYKLKTNDVVEIVTSASQAGPSLDWLKFVKTQQAKSKIKQWFKKSNRDDNIERGRTMLEEAAKRNNYQLSEFTENRELVDELLKRHNLNELDDLYAAVGYGGLTTSQVLNKFIAHKKRLIKEAELKERMDKGEDDKQQHNNESEVIVKGQEGMAVRFAKCCNPIPGDRIIGYITRGRGVSIHRMDCTNVAHLLYESSRIIEVEWANEHATPNVVFIDILGTERAGLLMDISRVLVFQKINILSINAKSDEKDGSVVVALSFQVRNEEQLRNVTNQLKMIKSVTEVIRK